MPGLETASQGLNVGTSYASFGPYRSLLSVQIDVLSCISIVEQLMSSGSCEDGLRSGIEVHSKRVISPRGANDEDILVS